MQYSEETKTLTIDYRFNEELKDIPEDTKIIIFEHEFPKYSKFNQKVDKLPQSLTHLTFGYEFNQKVDNLPQSLTHLTFGLRFNQKVDNLPQSLTHLTFHSDFNQKVDNLPKNITYLFFGFFNQKVDNLPKNITYLIFGFDFNQKVDKLPKNITHLTFGWCFNQKVDNLPKNLNNLKLGWYFQNEIILPQKLKKLTLTCNNTLNNLPEHIEKIYIYFSDEKRQNKKVENLPFRLKEIIIEDEKYKEYIKIPFGCILTIKKLNN